MVKKGIVIIILTVAVLAGCQNKSVPEAKKEAYSNWYRTRAQMIHSVAEEHFRVGQLNQARSKILEALSLDPGYGDGRLLLGKICIEQGHYAQAVDELTKVHQMAPQSSEVLYLLGVAQEKNNLLDDALISYRRSQALDGSNTAAVVAAGEVLVKQGHLEEARRYIESYLPSGGSDPAVYELGGRLAMMEKDYASACEAYQTARDLDYQNLSYCFALAQAQFLCGKYEEATENLKILMESEQYSQSLSVLSMLGDCYLASGRICQGRDIHLEATRLDPENTGAWINLAKAAVMLRDYPRAILAARQAMTLSPYSLDATLMLGYALTQDGQYTRAVNLLTPALGTHPRSAELQCLLGQALSASGKTAEAVRCYAAALRIDPENLLAKALMERSGSSTLSMVD